MADGGQVQRDVGYACEVPTSRKDGRREDDPPGSRPCGEAFDAFIEWGGMLGSPANLGGGELKPRSSASAAWIHLDRDGGALSKSPEDSRGTIRRSRLGRREP